MPPTTGRVAARDEHPLVQQPLQERRVLGEVVGDLNVVIPERALRLRPAHDSDAEPTPARP